MGRPRGTCKYSIMDRKIMALQYKRGDTLAQIAVNWSCASATVSRMIKPFTKVGKTYDKTRRAMVLDQKTKNRVR